MRSQLTKKKQVIVWDQFCVAYMRIVSDKIFKACTAEEKPEKSCNNCVNNKRKKRILHEETKTSPV